MTFDADAFLQSSTTDSNDTKIIPCPVGEYMGIIEKITPKQVQFNGGTETRIVIDVLWAVEDAGAKAATGRDLVTVKQTIFLDTNPQGGLDMGQGKNVALGRLREAVGKNNPGEQFAFAMLPGLSAKISVSHRQDKLVPEVVYAEVKMVTKLS